MAEILKMNMIGNAEISKVLRDLPPSLTRSVLISAQRYAAKPVVDEMKASIASSTKQRTGALIKSIGTKALRDRGRETNATITGPRIGGGFKGYHANLIEGGTEAGERRSKRGFVIRRKDGQLVRVNVINHPGTEARPFARPAIENNIQLVADRSAESIAIVMHRVMKRTIKRAGS